jgi:hypothetical protein
MIVFQNSTRKSQAGIPLLAGTLNYTFIGNSVPNHDCDGTVVTYHMTHHRVCEAEKELPPSIYRFVEEHLSCYVR